MLKFGNTYLNFGGTYLSGYKVPTYNVILQQNEGGIIGASPLTGNRNTEVTLSNTPSQDYVFNGYEISGSNLYDTNKFKFVDCDVTAMAKWSYEWPDPNPLNLPTNTMRVKCYPGSEISSNNSQYQVTKVGTEGDCSIYDIKTTANNWYYLSTGVGISQRSPSGMSVPNGVSDILGVNNSAITSVKGMFVGKFGDWWTYGFCDVSSICYFDMSNVTEASHWFRGRDIGIKESDLPIYNTSAVTSFAGAFYEAVVKQPITLDCRSCTNLNAAFGSYLSLNRSFPNLKNTYNVTGWKGAFQRIANTNSFINSQLVIPDYNFYNATDVTEMFLYNPYVSGGISSTYAKLSALGNQITAHSHCFSGCGTSSEQGRAELALIPSDWK